MSRTPEEVNASIERNVPEKTGKTLDEWIALLREQPFEKHSERVEWLTGVHGLDEAYAGAIAWKAGGDDASPEEMVADQFVGSSEELRPVYDCLVKVVLDLGGIVEPRADHVAFVNDRPFAVTRPAPGFVDLGLILAGHASTARLVDAPAFGIDGVTHAVPLASTDEVDDELRSWLAEAFAAAARDQ
jgi:Domain of unknown function (DUF4287)/Domain of unknown function (DUF5655)